MTEGDEAQGVSYPEVTLADLPESLQRAARNMGWTALMPVQAKAIPYIRARRDLMVQSRTGTGKTAAFILPILERIDTSAKNCQVLVLVPTRELAKQVTYEAERLSAESGINAVAVYGGVGYGPQISALRGGAPLVVGTPGRVLDHLMKGNLTLDKLKILVLDEADRMLSVGFYPDMKKVASYLPRERDGFMFSATYPPGVRSLADEFLNRPDFLGLSDDGEHVAETLHVYYEVPAMEKARCLVRIIEIENPDSAIIFCNTKATCHYVAVVLERFGYNAAELTADLTQPARESVMLRIREKRLRFLVATDLAARGIDIHRLSHVFLYDVPEESEMYIHRTGRTGRAGESGEAVSLVDPLELMNLKSIARFYKIPLEQLPLPTDEDVQAIVAERLTALLEARLRELDSLVRERMRRMIPLARTLADNDDELVLVAMLLDEYYQKVLHAAPETPGGPSVAEMRRVEKERQPKRARSGDREGDGEDGKKRKRSRRGGKGRRRKE